MYYTILCCLENGMETVYLKPRRGESETNSQTENKPKQTDKEWKVKRREEKSPAANDKENETLAVDKYCIYYRNNIFIQPP